MKSIIKYNLILIFFLLTQSVSFAQNSVKVKEENIITRMMYHIVEQNNLQDVVSGWRIQVLATTDRQKLETVKAEFQRQYPGVLTDWQHDKPYYKLRAGAFPSKLAATQLLYRLKGEFASAYPVKDNNIPPRQFLGY